MPRKLRFAKFTLSNRFPNNICITRNCSVIVVLDIEQNPNDSDDICIIGRKFTSLVDAFTEPYVSSTYSTFIASNLSSTVNEWSIDVIKGKMYSFPYKLDASKGPADINKRDQQWYVSPIHHTIL